MTISSDHAAEQSDRSDGEGAERSDRNGLPREAPLDARQLKVDPAWALRIPAGLAMRRQVLPLCEVKGEVQVICADPLDTQTLKAVERYLDRPIKVRRADTGSLRQLLRKVYGESQTSPDSEDPVALVNEILYAARLRQASDIHVDAEREGVRVRLRVDGQLEEYRRLPARVHAELLSRIKILAGMDIAEKRAPQDARFTQEVGGGQRVEIRVATLPTKHGERATLRILAAQDDSLTLETLGMSARDLTVAEEAIRRPHGLILATGPTGCGKTTTLTAALRRIIAQRPVNAISVQDPIEYDIPGVAQVEVDSAQKVTFSKALRSILRHDPDVLMIGEVRDQETADIAIKAALTGHLVLATLHTNSAASAVTRLQDLGVDRFLVAATLTLVISQRLVRRLCRACRRPWVIENMSALRLRRPEAASMSIFMPHGCVECAGRGYVGRLGLFELLHIDAELGPAIARGADEGLLAQLATAGGTPAMVDDALEKLREGLVSLDDVLAGVAV